MPTFGVSAGLLDRKHVQAMGTSVWEFLACLNWQTDAAGRVLGGKPLTAANFQDESCAQGILPTRPTATYAG